ncbi:MAG: chromosomal replication initiator protein DnaA [Desulfobulbaceae bacterium DB1]|nr:MAG: chromosomal replication initiator protein DnaA [Desulfobulbaceae bacterium DB1]
MLWEKIKEILSEKLPETAYSLWIAPLSGKENDNSTLELSCPDSFFSSWVADKYSANIQDALHLLDRNDLKIVFQTNGQSTPQALLSAPRQALRLPDMPKVKSSIRTLHPRFTFNEFIVGSCNFMAHSACADIAMNDTAFGNCLYLKAGTGLGKSHLTHAVAHHIIENKPATRLNYLSAQQLTSEMVKNIKNNTMNDFKNKYHKQCDVLLIEDVHTLAGRLKTQAELSEALDILLETGKKIIFTSSLGPKEIPDIDSGIRSRLLSGMVTTINPPTMETRIKIIRRKAEIKDLCLNEEQVVYLAEHIKGDIRQVESAIVSLKAQCSLLKAEPDFGMLKETLSNIIGQSRTLSPVVIRDFIATQFKIDVAELQSKTRKQSISLPRQIAMYLSRKYTDMPLTDIGKAFNRDHSTVVHSIRAITDKRTRNTSLRRQVELLEDRLEKKFL